MRQAVRFLYKLVNRERQRRQVKVGMAFGFFGNCDFEEKRTWGSTIDDIYTLETWYARSEPALY